MYVRVGTLAFSAYRVHAHTEVGTVPSDAVLCICLCGNFDHNLLLLLDAGWMQAAVRMMQTKLTSHIVVSFQCIARAINGPFRRISVGRPNKYHDNFHRARTHFGVSQELVCR